MSEIISQNPMYKGGDVEAPTMDDQVIIPTTTTTKNKKSTMKKVLLGGLVGTVAVAAFAVGYFVAPRETVQAPPSTLGEQVDDTLQVTASLEDYFTENPDLGRITPLQLNEMVDAYEADPDNWDDAMVPVGFVKLLLEQRNDEFGGARRLDGFANSDEEILQGYRRSMASKDFDNELVSMAWDEVEGGYPDAITWSDDKISVYTKGSDCIIKSKQSDSVMDWFNNLDLGKDDIYSVNKYNQRDESCGCEKKTWWWCSTYKSCPVHVKIGEGYDGFSKAWNNMRAATMSQIQSKCASSSRYVFTGYSRGAGIVALGASALKKEGILQASQIRLVTFGAPRALAKSFSDETHADFITWRMIYKKDPVPSLPYGWMGFRHFGEMVCFECGYEQGRDRPNFSWPFSAGDHGGYSSWV